MALLLDSFWRAVVYCMHPRVIALSLMPLLLMGVLALGLSHWYWDAAVALAHGWLDSWGMVGSFWGWLADLGWGDAKSYVAPLMVVALVTPLVVVLSLLLVAVLMTPALVALVAQRRFHSAGAQEGRFLCFESGVVSRLYGACVGGDGRVHATVADTAAGVDLAAADLGVADLPGDGV